MINNPWNIASIHSSQLNNLTLGKNKYSLCSSVTLSHWKSPFKNHVLMQFNYHEIWTTMNIQLQVTNCSHSHKETTHFKCAGNHLIFRSKQEYLCGSRCTVTLRPSIHPTLKKQQFHLAAILEVFSTSGCNH